MLSLWQYQRKYYFIILQTSQPCGAGLFPFSREGRNGKRHIAAVSRAADKHGIVPALAHCGSIHAADGAQTYPYSSSRKRLEIGGTQKIL
jgi:hypothetical protein